MRPLREGNTLYTLAMLLLMGWYLLATLPYLADYPIVEAAQTGIAAPAYKLASQGVYGNDLYRGLYHSEAVNYEYMPLYPLAVALSFRPLGLGVWQARLVSIFCGLFVICLTYALGRRLFHPRLGIIGAAVLVLLAITVPRLNTGDIYPGAIPLLDIARVLRYDIMAPVWVLSACLAFWQAYRQERHWMFGLAGLFVGLATLSHIYGSFILAVLIPFLAWQCGRRILRQPAVYWLLGGWLLALIPWFIYIAQDPVAFQGQQLRHETRFNLLSPAFYLSNLRWEPWRYVEFLGGFRRPTLFPRAGIWLAGLTLVGANFYLWRQIRDHDNAAARFLFLTLPVLALMLGLLISYKRFTYIALWLPFFALQVGLGIEVLWSAARKRGRIWMLGLILLIAAAAFEGVWETAANLQAAARTPRYQDVMAPAREVMPPDTEVLAHHDYWLALTEYDVRALDLAFSLSDPMFGLTATSNLPETLLALNAAYVIVPEQLLHSYRESPESLPGPKQIGQWRDLDHHLQEHCTLAAGGEPSSDYGQVLVFDCREQVSR